MKSNLYTFNLQRFLLAVILTLAGIQGSKANTICNDTIEIPFYYRLGSDLLMCDYRGNQNSLLQLEDVFRLGSSYELVNIRIAGMTSPEGTIEGNTLLSRRRAYALKSYIIWKFPHIDKGIIEMSTCVADMLLPWQKIVENDPCLPRREKVLEILHSDKGIPTKWANIQLLAGTPADYMRKNIFPRLRNAVSCVVILRKKETMEPTEESLTPLLPDTVYTDALRKGEKAAMSAIDTLALKSQSEEIMQGKVKKEYIYTPLFAAKTNLLFDLVSLLNVEMEVPIGKRFSVAAEWIFPWWLWEDKQHCLELLNGNVEGRYWLGNRNKRDLLTGWFIGLYAGGGYYDLEWEKKGYQGEFFIATGLGGGFSHKIAKNLHLEYSLGVGYMQTKYRQYEGVLEADNEWHLYRRNKGKYTWIGPTRARISLVWMLYSRKQKGDVK